MMKVVFLGLLLLLVVSAHGQNDLPTMATIQRLMDEGERDAALDLLEQRIQADANDVQARFMKAMTLLNKGDKSGAVETFSAIVRRFPRLPEASNNLAALYAADGDYEKARQALRGAIANVPDYPLVHKNLGDLYVKMAMDSYRTVLALSPDDEIARTRLEFLEKLIEPSK